MVANKPPKKAVVNPLEELIIEDVGGGIEDLQVKKESAGGVPTGSIGPTIGVTQEDLRKSKILDAANNIAKVIILTYLALIFIIVLSHLFDSFNNIDPSILNDLNTIVAVVVGFYFGQKLY